MSETLNESVKKNKFNCKGPVETGQIYMTLTRVKCYDDYLTDELDDDRNKWDFLLPRGALITFVENVSHTTWYVHEIAYKFLYDNKMFFVGYDDLKYLELVNE